VIGHQISHYYIIRALGRGGMGAVYEARDTKLPRSVAIKVLKEELSKDLDALRRFKREARLASSLNHPNICTILEVGDEEAQSFIAMELLEGASLKARLLGAPLTLDEIVDISIQVADGLAAAHAEGIIHRDITPANIFLTGGGLVKLLDFGLAKHFPEMSTDDEQTTDELTQFGATVGTIYYMSPEQLAGAPVDARCDLFALGVVMYQMATGARPFDNMTRPALSEAIRHQSHVPVRQLASHHPAELERIIDTLLAKHVDKRYQSAAAVRAALDGLRRSLPSTRRASGGPAAMFVAVLPFEMLGPADSETAAFGEGLAADLRSELSRVEGVSVAPRTSTSVLAGRSIHEIGSRLAVQIVIEGTVQRTDRRIRATANVVDAASERSLCPALVADRVLEDPLTTQDELARGLCDGIRPVLSRAPASRYSQEPEAYHAFKRGQHLWKSCFEGGWRAAIEQFQHAIDRDPQFAVAHAALASAYNFLGFYCLVKPSLAFDVAGRAAERALAIAPTFGPALVELALAKFGGDWDWEGAENAFRRALVLDAENPLAHVHYSWLLILLGRRGPAFAEAQRSAALAPSSRFVAAARAQTMYLAGEYDAAIELCTECLAFDDAYVFARHIRGLCHLVKAERDEAIADLEQAVARGHRAPFYLGILGRCYAQFGLRDKALALVDELLNAPADTYVPPQCYVFIYAALGEGERALQYQEKAYEDGASPFNYLFPGIRELYALSPDHRKRLEQMRLVL
jgi:eukaryotic-like serine/threonine-protein kinase